MNLSSFTLAYLTNLMLPANFWKKKNPPNKKKNLVYHILRAMRTEFGTLDRVSSQQRTTTKSYLGT